MPRGGPAGNPRLTMMNASTGGDLGTCPVRDTRCLCATGTSPEYRWDTGIARQAAAVWPRSVGEWFRLWRTPLGVGNADAGVCVVLSCKGRKPEPAGCYRPEARGEGRRR